MNLNDLALVHVKELIRHRSYYHVEARRLQNGSTLLDAGVRQTGGIAAGLAIARASVGGLCQINLRLESYGKFTLPTVEVATDLPYLATIVCQLPIPKFQVGKFVALCSGPGKIYLRKPDWVFQKDSHIDRSKSAVFIFQSESLPNIHVAEHLAESTGLKPEQIYMIALSAESSSGATLVASMALEASVLRLVQEKRYDQRRVLGAVASAPISPTYEGMWRRPGVTPDDMVRYGSRVAYFIRDQDSTLRRLVKEMTVESLPNYGLSFYQILKSAGFSFSRLEEEGDIFATGQVTMYNIMTGKIHSAGRIHHEILERLMAGQSNTRILTAS
jgi:methenyltetrahydromethanopterin cyclohydrolase